jgi:hypothetical protein
MRQEGQVVGRERRRLKVRKKGDIMERIELLNYCPGHSWDAGISPTAADIPEAAAGCLCQSVQHSCVWQLSRFSWIKNLWNWVLKMFLISSCLASSAYFSP